MMQRWQTAPTGLVVKSGDIDIWYVDLEDAALDAGQGILSADEQQRAARFAFPADKNRLVRSRVALREILAQLLACSAEAVRFSYNEHSKPELAAPVQPGLSFNLSHSGSTALIAIASDRAVGIDVDRIGRTDSWQAIAKRSFSEPELKQLWHLPPAEQETAFYRTWTQKEAYTKALGDGFSYGFPKFSVRVDAEQSTGLVHDSISPQAEANWHICAIDAGPGMTAALAYSGSTRALLRYWKFHIPSV